MKRILLTLLAVLLLVSCTSQAEPRSHNAIWLWSLHMPQVDLDEFAAKDIDHIILHEASFRKHGVDSTLAFVKAAEERGMMVHIWMQVFKGEKWVSPVDDENNCYRQDYFDEVISRAESYLDMGIKGIHLDYIRFGGTAYKHNPSEQITATGAITEFCRQISTRLKAKDKDVILSAALMPEPESTYYYGQDPNMMGRFIDILMPMIYRYSPTYSRGTSKTWATDVANWFVDNSGRAKVWAGTTTYRGDDGAVKGMAAEDILADCKDFRDNSRVDGIVLFRYGLGELPDLSGLWDDK